MDRKIRVFARVKLIIEEIQVIDQILEVLIKFKMNLKLQHQHEFVSLEACLFLSISQVIYLHSNLQIKYLVEATEEASIAYNKAVTRLREYQGVDSYFDSIGRQCNDIKLEGMQWKIHQVEMDLKRSLDQRKMSGMGEVATSIWTS
ncbi:hypothetical protein M5K25_009772 [Dendrobium thyrsiflorum]|uniref:Uncharacterized protein n=1 Tax=Dendrobium thyrsiflorum TaxID=117978 RepID=A0ABD0V6J5_DENTH